MAHKLLDTLLAMDCLILFLSNSLTIDFSSASAPLKLVPLSELYLENALYEYFYKTDEGRSPESVYKKFE